MPTHLDELSANLRSSVADYKGCRSSIAQGGCREISHSSSIACSQLWLGHCDKRAAQHMLETPAFCR